MWLKLQESQFYDTTLLFQVIISSLLLLHLVSKYIIQPLLILKEGLACHLHTIINSFSIQSLS